MSSEDEKYIFGKSPIFTPEVINVIHVKADLGRYRMRGFSMFKKVPGWDELTFLPGTLPRFVIVGYREKCETRTVIGPRAKRPLMMEAGRAVFLDTALKHCSSWAFQRAFAATDFLVFRKLSVRQFDRYN